MPNFDDLYSWVDENNETHVVDSALSTVYDKANRESATGSSPDFSACGEGMFTLRDGVLEAHFLITFSDRIHGLGNGNYRTGKRNIWRVRLLRDGNIDVFQTGWTTRDIRLTNVERLDTAGAQFAIGHLRSRSTKALLSFSFDKLQQSPLI
jgi:hypothetical protein